MFSTIVMSQDSEEHEDIDVEDVLDELEDLENEVSSSEEKSEVRRVRELLEKVPDSEHIGKYTLEDIGEAFVGSLIFSLPFLVEGGVFEIADWFATNWVGPVPILLLGNIFLIIGITAGLLYAVDIREVKIRYPILGLVPRRLTGHLVASLLCVLFMMFFWGRIGEGDPTGVESVCRVAIVWMPATLGAVLADVLPGESEGEDINEILD